MLRAQMSLEKMRYDAQTGTLLYRSKMHRGLKKNFQAMPGAQWLEKIGPIIAELKLAGYFLGDKVIADILRRAGENEPPRS